MTRGTLLVAPLLGASFLAGGLFALATRQDPAPKAYDPAENVPVEVDGVMRVCDFELTWIEPDGPYSAEATCT